MVGTQKLSVGEFFPLSQASDYIGWCQHCVWWSYEDYIPNATEYCHVLIDDAPHKGHGWLMPTGSLLHNIWGTCVIRGQMHSTVLQRINPLHWKARGPSGHGPCVFFTDQGWWSPTPWSTVDAGTWRQPDRDPFSSPFPLRLLGLPRAVSQGHLHYIQRFFPTVRSAPLKPPI